MKKIIGILLVLGMCFCLSGCGEKRVEIINGQAEDKNVDIEIGEMHRYTKWDHDLDKNHNYLGVPYTVENISSVDWQDSSYYNTIYIKKNEYISEDNLGDSLSELINYIPSESRFCHKLHSGEKTNIIINMYMVSTKDMGSQKAVVEYTIPIKENNTIYYYEFSPKDVKIVEKP